MTTKLKAVPPKTAEPTKPKILVFGKPGVGKTWASLDFPNVYYIDTENGASLSHYTDKLAKSGGVYFGPEQGSLDFKEVITQVQALATEKHTFKTLVIDSLSRLFALEVQKEAERLGEKNAFGADKKPAVANMRRLIAWLSRLDMNVILICHEKPLWGTINGDRTEIGVTFDAWEKLDYELDLCLNVKKLPNGNRTATVTKSRLLEFPEGKPFPWSFAEFAHRYGEAIIEKESTPVELASPELVAEILRFLDIVKIPEDQVQKWLCAAGANNFAEMDKDKAEKVLTHLKGKVQ